jgi:hypothetical protein
MSIAGQELIDSPLNPNATRLIQEAYKHRFLLDRHMSAIHSREDFIKKIKNEAFQQSVVKPFHKKLGIVSGSYAIVDHKNDSIWVVRSEENNRYVPFYPISPNGYFGEQTDNEGRKKLLDFMFESDRETLSLSVKPSYKAPYFLQNLPPHQSSYAFPPLPFEKKLRSREEINYLFCYTGEVVFHTYAWRWIIRYAQSAGFDATIDLTKERIPHKTAQNKFWSTEYWKRFFIDVPELKWLEYLEKEDRSLKNKKSCRQLWNDINHKLDVGRKSDYNFQEGEWDNLGLTEENPVFINTMRALKSYSRHVLKHIDPDQYRLSNHKLTRPVVGSVLKERQAIQEVNALVDEILMTKEKDRKEQLIKKLSKFGAPSRAYCHFMLRKIIFEFLAINIPKAKAEITVADLLRQLNRMTRFPLMFTYYQIALSAKKMPVEYYFFPITRSYKYPFEANLPSEKTVKHNSNVVIACVCLKPIWAVEKDYTMTREGSFYTDQEREGSLISDEAFARLRIIQDYLRRVSGPLVDDAFYGGIIRKDLELATKESQFFFQTHEIRRLIICIRPETPRFILDEIRSYFNIIFGSKWFILNSFFYNKGETLPQEFEPGNTYYELLSNAALLACKIHCIVDLAESGAIHQCSEEEFNNQVAELSKDIQIRVEKKELHKNFNRRNDKGDEYAAILYFIAAIICGIRNALKHRDEEYPVWLEKNEHEQQIEIVNYKVVSPAITAEEARQIKKPNLGSTAISLKYYITEYADFNEAEVMKDLGSNKFLTSIPIPKF